MCQSMCHGDSVTSPSDAGHASIHSPHADAVTWTVPQVPGDLLLGARMLNDRCRRSHDLLIKDFRDFLDKKSSVRSFEISRAKYVNVMYSLLRHYT